MTHILATHRRSEFLATPQLIRFEYAKGEKGHEPTLLIKGSTLLLKYIALGSRMQLLFAKQNNRTIYALNIHDDKDKPAALWSVLESEEEISAVEALGRGDPLQIFLFNELALNVAWASAIIPANSDLILMVKASATGHVDHSNFNLSVSQLLTIFHEQKIPEEIFCVIDIPITTGWQPIYNHFITSHITSSPIDLFQKNEGNQQEQIAVWLTDNLHAGHVYHSPQIPKGNGFRELIDILLSHEFGSILIESKTLTIFGREQIPDRVKLAHDVSAHITKAANQLRGGMRRLKNGTPVTSIAGAQIDAERTKPMHGIILIPDLHLIEEPLFYGLPFMHQFMQDTGGFIHILDIFELLRVVQAAEMIAARSEKTTPIIAFDYYLVERARMAMEAGTLCIEVLLRFPSGQSRTS